MRTLLTGFAVLLLLLFTMHASAANRTLDIYFIDVEGGAATLIVTPTGESILIDTGFPGQRDASRIAQVARDVAGLTQIDHCVITHWHRDHVGGLPSLAKLIPIKNYYDHGLPATLGADLQSEYIEAYKQATNGKTITLKPGDEIKLQRSPKYLPPLEVRVVAAGGMVVGENSITPQIRPCGADFEPQAEDKTDNANSVAILLTFGRFKFFDGGDLTWNVENRLACPKNVLGAIDVFQVDHHGTDSSNNPKLMRAIQPRVAIIDSGPRKGAEPNTFATLKQTPQIEAIYQLHRNLRTRDKDNAMAGYIANEEETCQGNFIKVAIEPDSQLYTVSIPAKHISRRYDTR